MGFLIDLQGKRFGRLVVLRKAGFRIYGKLKHKFHYWLCVCDCGKQKTIAGGHLRNGHAKSCGCFQADCRKRGSVTHGDSSGGKTSTEYNSWCNMLQRCTNRKRPRWRDWGGRGIKVCDRWRKFKNFLEDMGRKPGPNYSIDRFPDNNGNYEPGNCRWATWQEQVANQRKRKKIGKYLKRQRGAKKNGNH